MNPSSQSGGRQVERHAALRPSVASAMVTLAGNPGRLLDPCCGTGTILRAAQATGWQASGIDIDPAAVKAARRNTACTDIGSGDAPALPYADYSFDAWASNPPFGKQHALAADVHRWLGTLYTEAARVVRPEGHIVVVVLGRLFGGTRMMWSRSMEVSDLPSPEEEDQDDMMPEFDEAFLGARDDRLLAALHQLHEQRSAEAIEVAVVYGAGHRAGLAGAVRLPGPIC